MEARVKSEFRELSLSDECFVGRECQVGTESAMPLATSAFSGQCLPQPFPRVIHRTSQQRPKCRCRIDLSSPDTLERDFYAWLKGSEPASGTVPCLFASTSAVHLDFRMGQKIQAAPPFLTLDPLADLKSPPGRWDALGSSASSDCLSSHSSVSPGHCSSAISSSCSASSSSASSIGPFAPCSLVPPFPHHSLPPNHQMPLHPFFQQQHYRLMVTPSCADQLQQHKYSSKMAPSSSQNANAKVGPILGTRMRRKRNVDKASGRGTNLYGRSYCPGRPLSMEERAQIIHLFHGGMKVNAISKQLCISHGCVSKIITRFRETGNLMPSSHSECRRRKRQQQQQKNHLTNGLTDIGG
ncbi:hypothetical protein niasHS_010726 [Heterodera schachtii]|uniref:Paired domain-containing protein n=1 Tax=Heterodera schachtii TaxID=97005 RepID=A0ABD2ISD2_HETSC